MGGSHTNECHKPRLDGTTVVGISQRLEINLSVLILWGTDNIVRLIDCCQLALPLLDNLPPIVLTCSSMFAGGSSPRIPSNKIVKGKWTNANQAHCCTLHAILLVCFHCIMSKSFHRCSQRSLVLQCALKLTNERLFKGLFNDTIQR